MPTLKGVWIQEGSLLGCLYTLRTSVWGLFDVLAVVGGIWGPFFDAIPSLPFNCVFFLKIHKQTIMDEMFQAATMKAMFLLSLGILYSPCQAHHKLFGNPFNSAGTIASIIFITPGILFLQMH